MNRIDAKVKAVNRANDYANKLHPVLAAIFEPLVGKSILKAGGGILAKYEKLLPKFPSDNQMIVYRDIARYSLAWTVKVWESSGEWGTQYHETTVYVGNLEGAILSLISPSAAHRTDYSAEKIGELRLVYREAQKVADEARNALWPFGEFDR